MIWSDTTRPLLDVALIMLGGLTAVALARVLRGPTLTDRIAAFDVVAALLMAWLAVIGIAQGTAVFLDAALGLAILSFVGTLAAVHHLSDQDDRGPERRP